VGGFALQKKPSASDAYPAYTPYESNQGWHGEWFYIRNLVEASFLSFTGRRPEGQDSWSWGPSSREKKKAEIIEAELQKLVKRGLDGVRVFHTIFHHRVTPLAEWMRPMWMYNSPTDPDCASPEELPKDKVWSQLDRVL
jgi:hypothetical protein